MSSETPRDRREPGDCAPPDGVSLERRCRTMPLRGGSAARRDVIRNPTRPQGAWGQRPPHGRSLVRGDVAPCSLGAERREARYRQKPHATAGSLGSAPAPHGRRPARGDVAPCSLGVERREARCVSNPMRPQGAWGLRPPPRQEARERRCRAMQPRCGAPGGAMSSETPCDRREPGDSARPTAGASLRGDVAHVAVSR